MDFASSIPLFSGAGTPDLALQTMAMHVGWALVAGALMAFVLRAFTPSLRIGGVALVILACLVPGEWSPSWWLGLAFQTPSLTLQGIGLLYLLRMWRLKGVPPSETVSSAAYARWSNGLLLLASAIGWVFALDMFAAFDLHLYAIGFTPYAVLAGLLLACLLRLWSMCFGDAPDMQRYRDLAVIILCAMAVHLLTRLPTGNAWDALMDPWLWLTAQAVWLSRVAVWLALLARVSARRAGAWITTALGRTR